MCVASPRRPQEQQQQASRLPPEPCSAFVKQEERPSFLSPELLSGGLHSLGPSALAKQPTVGASSSRQSWADPLGASRVTAGTLLGPGMVARAWSRGPLGGAGDPAVAAGGGGVFEKYRPPPVGL